LISQSRGLGDVYKRQGQCNGNDEFIFNSDVRHDMQFSDE
jgi:hypothetical protein